MIRHHLMVMTDPELLEELEHGIPQLQIPQIQVKYVKLFLSFVLSAMDSTLLLV